MAEKFDKLAEKIGVVVQGGTVSIENVNVYPSPLPLPTGIPQNLPYSGAKQFVGRFEELDTLHQQLQQADRVVISAVSGMGGIGKTELALQYALQHLDDYSGGVCWLRAREVNISLQILEFAKLHLNLEIPKELEGEKLDLNQQVKWCWQHWQPPKERVLLILDDVIDLVSFRELVRGIPVRFRVLVTTRQKNLDASFTELSLDVFSLKDSIELLAAIIGKERVLQESQIVQQLCDWLGYLPLGLELVGRYLLEVPDLSLTEMLGRLKNQSLYNEALDLDEQQIYDKYMMTAQRGVRAAFNLTWSEINKPQDTPNKLIAWFTPLQKLLAKQSPRTSDLALLLGLFATEPIPWILVDNIALLLNWSKEFIEGARKQLLRRHIIQRVNERFYKIHPLIRYFLQIKLTDFKQAGELKRVYAKGLSEFARRIPDSPTRDVITLITPVIPHMAVVATTLIDFVDNKDLTWIFSGLGRFYEGQGFSTLARPWYEQCMLIAKERLNARDPHLATCINNLACVYDGLGLYDKAKELHKQALELRRCLFGNKHLDVASSLSGLGVACLSLDQFNEAETYHKQALEIRKRLLSNDHYDIAESLNNLATLYAALDLYDKAAPLIAEALRIWKKLLGNDHPHIALSLTNLAICYEEQGQYKQAKSLLLEALELENRILGDEHPITLSTMRVLASLCLYQGEKEYAESLYLKIIEARRIFLDQENHRISNEFSTDLINLANYYESQGAYVNAEELYREALIIKKRVFGDASSNIFTVLNNLGLCLYKQKKFSEAKLLYMQAKNILEETFGQEHEDVGLCLHNLSALYAEQGEFKKALLFCEQAQLIWARTIGTDHPLYARSLDRLAGIYVRQNRSDEAKFLYMKVLNIREKELGLNHPDTISTRQNLGELS